MAEGAKKKVVVVGGGVAGSKVAKELDDFADVTLVDPKTYFEITYPMPRSTVEPSFADRTLIPYSEFIKKGKHVQSSAVGVTAEHVVTESGENLSYDFLVIASGTVFKGETTKEDRIKKFEAEKKKVVDAQSVLIVGAGPVGIELAGEIITDFPDKKITIVQHGPRILDFLPDNVAVKTTKWFEKRKVDIILNDRVHIDNVEGKTSFETEKKVEIKADTYFVTVGKKVALDWIKSSDFLKGALNNRGLVSTEPTLQVKDFPKVFAAGDVTSFEEPKQGYLATEHAGILANNIKELIKNPSATNLKSYKPKPKPPGIVTLGRNDAIMSMSLPLLGNSALLGKIPAKLKSKDFFVGKSRQELGLKAQ